VKRGLRRPRHEHTARRATVANASAISRRRQLRVTRKIGGQNQKPGEEGEPPGAGSMKHEPEPRPTTAMTAAAIRRTSVDGLKSGSRSRRIGVADRAAVRLAPVEDLRDPVEDCEGHELVSASS
jgi:hypothetical protein